MDTIYVKAELTALADRFAADADRYNAIMELRKVSLNSIYIARVYTSCIPIIVDILLNVNELHFVVCATIA